MALFIVFEGIDGSGTTTQAKLLHRTFTRLKIPSVLLPAPGKNKLGKMLRDILGGKGEGLPPDKLDGYLAHLFAAERYYQLHCSGGIREMLQQGTTVITTRFFLSSLVYQGSNQENWERVVRLNQEFALVNPVPITFYLDVKPEEAVHRMGNRANLDIYENVEKLREVRAKYLSLFKGYPYPLCQVDGSGSVEQVHGKVMDLLWKWNTDQADHSL